MDTRNGCHVERITAMGGATEVRDARSVTLAVGGMGCPACANRVHNAIALTPGVLEVEVSLEAALARVVFDPARADGVDVVEAITAAGDDGRHTYRGVLVTRMPKGRHERANGKASGMPQRRAFGLEPR